MYTWCPGSAVTSDPTDRHPQAPSPVFLPYLAETPCSVELLPSCLLRTTRPQPECLSLSCVRLTAAVRISPAHSRQASVISDASAAEGDRSSTPSDINSPRHRTHSLCNVRPHPAAPHIMPPPSHLGRLRVSPRNHVSKAIAVVQETETSQNISRS